ncbi:MAG: branched-chain amino acid ABC transporter permease [Anaerotignum sp.]|nr:branched-chain amino acid ABC transporter permease [Anaerotignum sp.]MBR5123360.1 branched-chain amino acid ABC transporter permease [Anaerotignum sp.]MBR5816289.1 branched-chain amino acid ABC transporter permease [Anaerotignum sp.]MBR6542963.1 branched-chain amino acid ABC transporter permease [Anaerotignum sp.]
MLINGDTIIRLAAILGAFATLGTMLYKSFRWMEQQKLQEIEIENIKKEQCIMCYGLLATLDGLKQLGANGNVSDAYQRLEKHLNQTAHD